MEDVMKFLIEFRVFEWIAIMFLAVRSDVLRARVNFLKERVDYHRSVYDELCHGLEELKKDIERLKAEAYPVSLKRSTF